MACGGFCEAKADDEDSSLKAIEYAQLKMMEEAPVETATEDTCLDVIENSCSEFAEDQDAAITLETKHGIFEMQRLNSSWHYQSFVLDSGFIRFYDSPSVEPPFGSGYKG